MYGRTVTVAILKGSSSNGVETALRSDGCRGRGRGSDCRTVHVPPAARVDLGSELHDLAKSNLLLLYVCSQLGQTCIFADLDTFGEQFFSRDVTHLPLECYASGRRVLSSAVLAC